VQHTSSNEQNSKTPNARPLSALLQQLLVYVGMLRRLLTCLLCLLFSRISPRMLEAYLQ
jgi:hypothetical protein